MTTVDAILKEVYGPRIEDQLQNELVALKRIERTSDGVVETVGGKYVDFPIRVTRNTGIGYRLENEQLPAAGQQGYAAVHVPLRYGYGRVRFTGQVMELADKNYQAFASAMDREMNGLKEDTLKDCQRVVYGDSTGLMASVTTGGAGVNSVTVDNIQYLEVGMQVDLLTRATGAVIASDRSITAINETTKVVTLSGAVFTSTVADGLYRQGNYLTATVREPSGFELIVNDTLALHGVNPATQPKWKATVLPNPAAPGTLRALSEGIMIQACDTVRTKGGKTSVIFGSLGVRRAYFNLLTQQRRYTNTKEFAGGFTGLAFNYGTEVPMVEDVDCLPNRMYFLMESELKVYRNKEWHWMDADNSTLKWVRDFDAWEAVLRQYWEIGTGRRNGHAKLADIQEA
jgi:acyl-coenzyme A thioesterase PaaI-like protein